MHCDKHTQSENKCYVSIHIGVGRLNGDVSPGI